MPNSTNANGHDTARSFLGQLEDAFQRAKSRCGAVEHPLSIGGRGVSLDFAGRALVPSVMPAFEHLPTADENSEPALTVRLWDSVSTRVSPPPPPWPKGAYIGRGEIKECSLGYLRASFSSGTFSLFDPQSRVAYSWRRQASQVPPWEFAAPLRPILGWSAALDGGQLAHAAAVGSVHGAALLAARGGSGKSTTALACLRRGLLYAGDDYVLLRNDGMPVVFSLYNTAKVSPKILQDKLADFAGQCVVTDKLNMKSVLLLKNGHASQLVVSMPLRVILIPKISSRRKTRLRSASPIEALKALAPTTLFQLPGAGTETLKTLGNIVRELPCYALELGSDLDEIVDVIHNLLDAEIAAQEKTFRGKP